MQDILETLDQTSEKNNKSSFKRASTQPFKDNCDALSASVNQRSDRKNTVTHRRQWLSSDQSDKDSRRHYSLKYKNLNKSII